MVDQMLWLSLRTIINNFREKILGLDPIRASDGGWNMVNSHRVPFVKLWSPTMVPKPKDYPDYVDISGTFSDITINSPSPSSSIPSPTSRSNSQEIAVPSSTLGQIVSQELVHFLSSSDKKPIFVGFGSMVIDDAESVIRDFLDAAALVGARIIIQTGWSEISAERFNQLAYEAQMKAALVRDTEERNNQSMIFPSPRPLASSAAYQSPSPTAKTSVTTRDVMDNLLASVESNSSEASAATVAKTKKADPEPFLDVDADEGEEDYVTISPDDNLIQADDDPLYYSANSNINAKPTLSLNLTQHISGQVRKWFYSPKHEDSATMTNSAIIEPSAIIDVEDEAVLNPKREEKEWDEIPELHPSWKSSDACIIGPCPHAALFQHVAAAIHHGGAGTTSASLQAGLPTWICPFFGDQNFWGDVVYRRGLGPRPCPVQELTLSLITDSIHQLLSDETKAKAKAMAEVLAAEDGVTGATNAFYKHLPVDCMICDVSIFLGESRLADVYCQDCDFRLSREVSNCIHWGAKHRHRIQPLRYVGWEAESPRTSADGLIQGITGLVHEVADGVGDVIYQPVRGIYTDGLQAVPGATVGVVHGLVKGLITQPLSRVGVRFRREHRSTSTETIDSNSSSVASMDGPLSSQAPTILRRRAEGYGRNLYHEKRDEHRQQELGLQPAASSTTNLVVTHVKVDKKELEDLILSSLQLEQPPSLQDPAADDEALDIQPAAAAATVSPDAETTELQEDFNPITAHLDPAVIENVPADAPQLGKLIDVDDGDDLMSAPAPAPALQQEKEYESKSRALPEIADDDILTNELTPQERWERRQQSIMEAYSSAIQIRQLISSISKDKARSLSFDDFHKLIERAISRKEIISSTVASASSSVNASGVLDETNLRSTADGNRSAEMDTSITGNRQPMKKNDAYIARKIAEVCRC
jgi:hypothetical protein